MSESGIARLQRWKETAPKQHGQWTCYWAGCRCQPCRDAWAKRARERTARQRYEREKSIAAGDDAGGTGYVSAAASRKHLRYLSKHEIGYDTVSDLTGINRQKLWSIKQGKQRHVLAATAKKILAVTIDIRADYSLVSSAKARQRVGWLLRQGYTMQGIGQLLGLKSSVKLYDRITAINDLKIERLYQRCRALDRQVA